MGLPCEAVLLTKSARTHPMLDLAGVAWKQSNEEGKKTAAKMTMADRGEYFTTDIDLDTDPPSIASDTSIHSLPLSRP